MSLQLSPDPCWAPPSLRCWLAQQTKLKSDFPAAWNFPEGGGGVKSEVFRWQFQNERTCVPGSRLHHIAGDTSKSPTVWSEFYVVIWGDTFMWKNSRMALSKIWVWSVKIVALVFLAFVYLLKCWNVFFCFLKFSNIIIFSKCKRPTTLSSSE